MDVIEMIMQVLASPEARNVPGSVNASGHMRTALIPWKCMICLVVSAVRSDRLYALRMNGRIRKIKPTVAAMLT